MNVKWSNVLALVFLVLCFSITPICAQSADETEQSPGMKSQEVTAAVAILEAAPAEKPQVTIYGGVYAQVEETRTLTSLHKGLNKVRLNGIAKQYRANSLKVFPPKGLDVRSWTYQPANLTGERLLSESIGRRVRVNSKESECITGELLSFNENQLVLETSSGHAIVSRSDSIVVEDATGKDELKLQNTASMVLEVEAATDGDYALAFLYESDGLGFEVEHTLIFQEDQKRLESMETSVSIHNNSGTSFKQATVRLMSGDVTHGRGFNGYNKEYSDAPGAGRARVMGGEAAHVVEVQDQKEFVLDRLIDLNEGSRQEKLTRFSDVPVTREYYIPNNSGAEGSVSVRIELDNCEKSHMGRPLPAGAVKVYQRIKEHRTLIKSTSIEYRAEGEKFKLDLTPSKDLKFKKTATSEPWESQDPNIKAPKNMGFVETTYTVEIESFKKTEDVTVTVEVNLPLKQDVPKPLIVKSANEAYTDLTVSPKGKQTVTYKIRSLVYQ